MALTFAGYDTFLGNIALGSRGAPAALQIREIRAAVIRLCKEARVWPHVYRKPLNLTAGQQAYELDVEDLEAQIVAVNSFVMDGRCIFPASKGDWPYGGTQRGKPQIWREEEPGMVVFYPIPDTTGTVSAAIDMELAPSSASRACPRFLFDNYASAIKYAALAELLNLPGQNWTNPQMSISDYRQLAKEHIARARIEEKRGGAADRQVYLNVPNYLRY